MQGSVLLIKSGLVNDHLKTIFNSDLPLHNYIPSLHLLPVLKTYKQGLEGQKWWHVVNNSLKTIYNFYNSNCKGQKEQQNANNPKVLAEKVAL